MCIRDRKKRLEFLMKKSEFYAHFMAKKLGIADEHNTALQFDEKEGEERARPAQVAEINEEEALEDIKGLITSQRQTLHRFDIETQQQRMAAGGPAGKVSRFEEVKNEDFSPMKGVDKLDFSQVLLETSTKMIECPKSFHGELKEYQVKGLRWLDNLFDQGINGILADEMGLGKTIQAIALLAHLSENKGNWGPFLVVAPPSTLYNWQQEINRFCPSLKVLPYWGNLPQRKMLRKFFNQKNLGSPNSPFNVVVTSYQMVVADEKIFQRMKWQYMILDEAQAIKNINSLRWKTLLSFNSRNKLLLTGTPIQNTMAELWALLHFIMPTLFDSHEQFQEWFSKDIEAQSQVESSLLNESQLRRLHALLKPFMLRRVKKDVESEIGAKKEYQILCEMTPRQQEIYDSIRRKLSVGDFFTMFESKAKVDNLMNLVMQLRKVCNHPELFERKPCLSPFYFYNIYSFYTGDATGKVIAYNSRNSIEFRLPKLVYDEMRDLTYEKSSFIRRNFNMLSEKMIYELGFPKNSVFHGRLHSPLRFLGLPPWILSFMSEVDLGIGMILLHFHLRKTTGLYFTAKREGFYDNIKKHYMFWISRGITEDYASKMVSQLYVVQDYDWRLEDLKVVTTKALAPAPTLFCSSAHSANYNEYLRKPLCIDKLLYGELFNTIQSFPNQSCYSSLQKKVLDCVIDYYPAKNRFPYFYENSLYRGLMGDSYHLENLSNIEVPTFSSLIHDSGKLKYLDKLLTQLRKGGHRVLIFCQMTKMIDILEDYMIRKKYQYFRLDGSCNIADRRDMVDEFQSNTNIFTFLLSTRAGGLGVTLTAADTVVFFDNDWNPTMDAQATDRAHRIGQTKDVSVYRLVTKSTIEERIVRRAQQKQHVQATVYSGGAFKADVFKPQEVMALLFDENEISLNAANKFISKGNAKRGKKKAPKPQVVVVEDKPARKGKKVISKEPKEEMEIEPSEVKDGNGEQEIDFSAIVDQ
eukprot:TRINITY_DN13107_c0_g1_i1.p1 TRINITY_DN13107_c0_g1~~TRINITY_DN13107_c0_g1_i1.p1  ORF type:complete len:997 (-),score=305.63 TRINITY_DN13107_c0_g1_i1:149-3079(-)